MAIPGRFGVHDPGELRENVLRPISTRHSPWLEIPEGARVPGKACKKLLGGNLAQEPTHLI